MIGADSDPLNVENGAAHRQEMMHERIHTRTSRALPARTAASLHELRQNI
jgi:hypothetical protein